MATNNGELRGKVAIRYRECQHNYAAQIMCHAFDGCGDFLPRGEPGTPEVLLCGVCGCHRNYHRREVLNLPPLRQQAIRVNIFNRHTSTVSPQSPPSPPPQPQSHNTRNAKPLNSPSVASLPTKLLNTKEIEEERGTKKKRRTNFTQEQKDQMRVFAERLGWHLHKHKDTEIQQFCEDIAITHQALKVWINNNKRLMGPGKSSTTHQN